MRKAFMMFLVLGLVLFIASQSMALLIVGNPEPGHSWSQGFLTDYKPNVVNLFLSGTTEKFQSGSYPLPWTYQQLSVNTIAQGYKSGGYGSGNNVAFTETFSGSLSTPLTVEWQELYYNWGTKSVDNSFCGTLTWNGSGWSVSSNCTQANLKPVPDVSSSMLLFGICLSGLFGVRKKIWKN